MNKISSIKIDIICPFSLCRVPTMGGKPLDLYRLFIEVTSRGGLEKAFITYFSTNC